MKQTNRAAKWHIGANVTFNADRLSSFLAETSNIKGPLPAFQKQVISRANSVGSLLKLKDGNCSVKFYEEVIIEIPKRYLVVLPRVC